MIEAVPTGRLDAPTVALVTPAALVVTGELPRGRSPVKKETDPVGPAPDDGLTTAVNCTGCPKGEPMAAELVTLRRGAGGGRPPGQPDLIALGVVRRGTAQDASRRSPVEDPEVTKYSAPEAGVKPFSNTGSTVPPRASAPLVIRP